MITPDRNADQIDYWNGEVGRRWASLQERLDALFTEVTTAAIEAAAPRAGESVIDVGCGCGATTLALARWLGPTGRVLGVDVSEPMLAVARERVKTAHAETVALLLADAAVHSFYPESADLAFSRFGVMFFDRPAEAFSNIRIALKPGGRLAFVCWRAFKDNPYFAAPYWAAKPQLGLDEPKTDPDAPGPFAFADADRVRRILAEAGFGDIAIEPADVTLTLAGPGDLDEATGLVIQVGPVARALAAAEPARRPAAEAAVREALVAFDGPEGVRAPARVWVVTAAA